MSEVYQAFFEEAVELHKQKKFEEAEARYHKLLNASPFNETVLFLLSDIWLHRDKNGAAIVFLTNLLKNNPQHAQAWVNLGIAFRHENRMDEAQKCWEKSISIAGDTIAACSNMSGLYADSGRPELALEWIDRALKLEPDNVETKWHRALALLSIGRFDEGWKLYESRLKLEAFDRRDIIQVPYWDFGPTEHLYVHGEQGIGDEVMFACGLSHVKAKRVTVEVHHKVAPLIKQTWPQFAVVTTVTPGDYTAKIPIGSLVGRFGFHPTPYLKPAPERVLFYREQLEKLGPPPYLALTWVGGLKPTRAEQRSLSLEQLNPFRGYTCVSAQYGDNNPYVEKERADAGLPKINDESTGLDLHEQAALFKAVDAVVTVQQTAVHVAGSVGAKCYALISPFPHWRYGIKGERMPWYDSVKLFRRKIDEEWAPVIARAKEAVDADIR